MCGAVECQKSSGSLHLHFWNFIQRAHQHHSLAEIAAMVEKALITADQLKKFCAVVCCESYPLPEQADKDVESTEAKWPKFSEQGEAAAGQPVEWGPHRPGRIPPFVWNDKADVYEAYCSAPASTKRQTWSDLQQDATKYEGSFKSALQENQLCVQHHIHPKNKATGHRYLPNTCKNTRCKDKCKHDFPRESRMNEGQPLLVCKGIAEERGLPASGPRSALGSILGTRNSPWLNGTAPALVIGMSGGNTDVQLNDLLPLDHCTHEASACKRQCVPHDPAKRAKALRKTTCRMQALQSRRNGYFGWYISKRQRVGALEIRKCIDKLHTLRARIEAKSKFQQQRAVSGRMITDIEMNGTMRGRCGGNEFVHQSEEQ